MIVYLAKLNTEQKWIVGRIAAIVIILAIGIAFIGVGTAIFVSEFFIQTQHSYQIDFDYKEKKDGNLNIVYRSDQFGIRENRNIDAVITVKILESIPNSTYMEITFPLANVGIPEVHDYVLKEGKSVVLDYAVQHSKNISLYTANVDLIYYNPGSYDATLKVSDSYNSFKDTFETGLDVKDFDFYPSKKRENSSFGLLFIVVGVGIIAASPVGERLVDLIYRFKTAK